MSETTTTKTPKTPLYQVGQIVRDLSTGAIARIEVVTSVDIDGTTEHFYTLDESVPLLPDAGFDDRSRNEYEVVDAVSENYLYLAHSSWWDLIMAVKVNGTNGDLDDADLALAHVAATRLRRRNPDMIEATIEKLLARIRTEVAQENPRLTM